MRQKLSEDFHLNSGSFTTTIGKCGDGGYAKRALFKLPEEEGGGSGAGDGLVLVFRLEKALQQGGLDAALEVYTKKQQQQQVRILMFNQIRKSITIITIFDF
jgi:hypothetical protein